MSDYLFDKQGEPDPEVAELERVLKPHAYRGAPPVLPPRRRPRLVWISTGLAAAAALLALVLWRPWHHHAAAGAEWVDTGARGVLWRIGTFGTVELGPGSRARRVEGSGLERVVELAHGSLQAKIDAPARRFIVVTPHARVIDLGCAFDITVDEAGQGRVTVTQGSVAVAGPDGKEVTVPAGGVVALTAAGPGTPQVTEPPHEPAPPPRPAPVIAPSPAPAAPPTPAIKAAPKHGKAKHAASKHGAKSKKPVAAPSKPATKPASSKKPDDGVKLHHDAFKDLPR